MKKHTVSEDTEVVINGKKILLEKGDKVALEARRGRWPEHETVVGPYDEEGDDPADIEWATRAEPKDPGAEEELMAIDDEIDSPVEDDDFGDLINQPEIPAVEPIAQEYLGDEEIDEYMGHLEAEIPGEELGMEIPEPELGIEIPEPGSRPGDLGRVDDDKPYRLGGRPESWKKRRRAQPKEFTQPRELRVMEDTEVVLDGKKYLLEKGDKITIL